MAKRTSIEKDDEMMMLLDECQEIVDENTMAGTFKAAMRHTIQSKDNLEDYKDELPPQLARKLGTRYVKLTGYNHVKVR